MHVWKLERSCSPYSNKKKLFKGDVTDRTEYELNTLSMGTYISHIYIVYIYMREQYI